jgi:hypothetical protein
LRRDQVTCSLFRPAGSEAIILAIECRWPDAEHLQGSSGRQMQLPNKADDLQLRTIEQFFRLERLPM